MNNRHTVDTGAAISTSCTGTAQAPREGYEPPEWPAILAQIEAQTRAFMREVRIHYQRAERRRSTTA